MTTTHATAELPAPPPERAGPMASGSASAVRRAYRDTDASVIGGVAAGLAEHLGLPVLAVRAFFVVTAVFSGFGVLLYAALWIFVPAAPLLEQSTPGGESATRGGRRPAARSGGVDKGPAIALLALGFGAVVLFDTLLGAGALIWPAMLGVAGVALLWRQADAAQRERWIDGTGRLDLVRMVFGKGGWRAYVRVGVGVGLMLFAVILAGGQLDFGNATALIIAGLIVLGAGFLVVGPWMHQLASDLGSEREERIRSQERADMAAHLHDSVLQTLALIQRNSGDPAMVQKLARAQERDLREWLFSTPAEADETFAAALKAATAEVEDAHGVTVDVVVVGDGPFDETVRPIVAATREAVTNAAKHAGTGRVDVYAEATEEAFEVFVRDRGAGFVVDEISADRHGVRDSIIDRMSRHGGSAVVRSSPGEGTEVRLKQPRTGNTHSGEERR
ncbi:PspC domain-containing protein [Nocardioides sp. NPDC004968]|uniref:PspC domain-containing protein n=1 Tax=Nocardioides sp. NPDC004968 TaxID=3155894 RepID=UPI0033B042CF